MRHYDELLKMYADNGLRTLEDWSSMGRELKEDAKPRTEAMHRGKALAVYDRDQTRRKAKAAV